MVQSSLQLSPATSVSAPSDELTYARLLATIWRRRFWFFPIFLSCVGLSVAASFFLKPSYISQAQYLLEPSINGSNKGGGAPRPEQEFTDPGIDIDYATQINLMRSPEILQKLINRLKPEYPGLKLEKLQKTLSVTQLTEQQDNSKIPTKVIRVSYVADDPIQTQRVLKVLQELYRDYNLQQQRERLSKGLGFINAQIPLVQKRLLESEAALQNFRQSNNLVDPETQSKLLTETLKGVQLDRQETLAKYQEAQARYNDLSQRVGKSPQEALDASRVAGSARFQKNLDELQKVEFELAQKQAQFTDDSPVIQDLKAQRQRILSLLPEELRRIMGSKAVQSKSGDNLLNAGQLSNLDIQLVDKLVSSNTDLKAFSARDQVLRKTEERLRQQISQFPNLIAQYGRLEPAVEMHRKLLQNLLESQQSLGMEIARGGLDWKVVESPRLGKNNGPSLIRNLALGIVVGLFLGGLAAFLRDLSDDAVHTSDDLRRHIDLPLLGIIPELPKMGAKILPQDILTTSKLPAGIAQLIHWAPFRESMDVVYQNIQMSQRTPPRSLVMTSALPKEGKSTLSLGLAMSAARLNYRVLVIDADLRNPSLHHKLDMANTEGLSTILSNPYAQVQPQHKDLTPGCAFDVLTSGPLPADPPKLLSTQQWRELIQYYEAHYDLVIVDAPPVLGIVDTLLLASVCEGVVMTGRMSVVTRSELNSALDTLSQFNVLGVIANGLDRKAVYYAMDKTPEERMASMAGVSSSSESAMAVSTSLPSAVQKPLNLGRSSVHPGRSRMNSEEMQRRIRDLESTIYKMTSFIQQQQEELEAHRWTVNDLQGRFQRDQSHAVKEELDCAVAECQSLEQSIQPQKEKLQEQQRILDEYYEQFMKDPSPANVAPGMGQGRVSPSPVSPEVDNAVATDAAIDADLGTPLDLPSSYATSSDHWHYSEDASEASRKSQQADQN